MRAAVVAAALFPPQVRDWSLPAEVPLTSRAAQRLSREATTQPFAKAAAVLSEDWGTALDGKQIQRWAQVLGGQVVNLRTAEVQAHEQGWRPGSSANPPELLVIGMDGGRVQTREKQGENDSRWREDKVLTITSYLPGDGTKEHPPQPLVTTYAATMGDSESFGPMVRIEAERRGISRSRTVLVVADGGNWIDPLCQREKLHDQRIVDFYHAVEHVYEAARAALGQDSPAATALAQQLKDALKGGQVDQVIAALQEHAARVGPAQESDGPDHPRRVLANNVGYFQKHRHQMDYPAYRKKGWPIGSGVTESGVKQFNKRVKGTEQFWTEQGVEAILALRSLWLSEDDRWNSYWNNRTAYLMAA